MTLEECFKILLTENEGKLLMLKKAIVDHLPITIQYGGPTGEVKPGARVDIQPVALGEHFRTGNLVIWAYVTRGVSKTGLPDWKMFRVDRIANIKFNIGEPEFNLKSIPEYDESKTPDMMKSLRKVYAHSSEFLGNKETPEYIEKPKTVEVPKPIETPAEVTPTDIEKEPETIEPVDVPVITPPEAIEPAEEPKTNNVYDEVITNISDKVSGENGENILNRQDYETAVRDLFFVKQGEWKERQRVLGNNPRPGEGSRRSLNNAARNEIDTILKDNNIKISDDVLSEVYKRFLELI